MPTQKKKTLTEESREALPEDLRPAFDRLLEEYKFHCFVIHGRSMYSPRIIAELVKAGWCDHQNGSSS